MSPRASAFRRSVLFAAATCTAASLAAAPAATAAEALLVVEADTGKVLHADQATVPWYPASITKILTAYVALRAVREGRLTLDSLFRVSGTAAAAPPTKMGFAPGTTVTLDNALKMLMVKSANDVAITIAEGVSGSVENFAEQMNRHSKRLGMTQSHWVNPHGLPADDQITSARDMAMLARVVLREFPEYSYYWNLPGIRYGKRLMRNHNNLLGRYEGTDGMKTGFICASGFNVVATATRNGKRLIVVVLGSPSPGVRAVRAAQLFERGFQVRPLSWLTPGLGQLDALQPINIDPPNLRDKICGPNRRRPPSEEAADEGLPEAPTDSAYAIFLSTLRGPSNTNTPLFTEVRLGEPVIVHTGPKRAPGEVVADEPKAKGMAKKTATTKGGMGMASDTTTPALAHNPGNVTTDAGAEKKAAGMGMAKAKAKAAKKSDLRAMTDAGAVRSLGPAEPIPLTVLTGFLGAGKTSLLNRLVHDPALAGTAVIINEFGEIGLDHLLVKAIDDNMVLLQSGCLCCTLRGDLVTALEGLLRDLDNGRVSFRRVILETTGLADPAPVLQTAMAHPYLVMRYRLDGVITVVDAINGGATLDQHMESVKQAAIADRIVLAKSDLADTPERRGAMSELRTRLRALNPAAPVLDAASGEATPQRLLDCGLYDPDSKTADVRRWLADEAYAAAHEHHDHHHHDVNRHDDRIRAFTFAADAPIPAGAFEMFIDLVRSLHGPKLLRLKGIVKIAEFPDEPLVIHGVQHVMHPPVRLPHWPDADHRTRIVVIARELEPEAVTRLFDAFVNRAAPDQPDRAAMVDNPLVPFGGADR